MKEQIENAIEWVKAQKDIKGCITGSSLLGYFPNEEKLQDVDVFLYNTKSFTGLFYAMYHNPMFSILDPLELWKADRFRTNERDSYKKGILTIKFTYNTCVEVNLIYKNDSANIFAVLSTFDMDIISRGYDLEAKKMLDLSIPGNIENKIASCNVWNTKFNEPELWEVNSLLRQIERVIKYYRRGYNTDAVMIKYMELADTVLTMQDIFHSDTYSEKLDQNKKNVKAIKALCKLWLKDHTFTDAQMKKLKTKLKEF